MDFLLPIWNPYIVHPLEGGLRLLAAPLEGVVGPGLAGGLAIVLFTIILRTALLPLSLIQIRSQKAQLSIQPEMKVLQRKFKGDREGMARAQMALYKERGVNPTAGCLPLVIQLPILFGMYAAMSQLATMGMTLDQVTQSTIQPGQVVYAAERHQQPLPFNQFVLADLNVVPQTSDPITISINQDQSSVTHDGVELLQAVQGLTLTAGQAPGNQNPPNTPQGSSASIFLKAGVRDSSGTVQRSAPVTVGEPLLIEVWTNAANTNADSARAVITFDPAALQVTQVETPQIQDIAFKSPFLWLPSLGQPDVFHVPSLPFTIPGLLLIVMTISSYVSQRMTTMPSDDPQQQAMMRSMAFMPLMYLFFFLGTPAGLVLYWLTSNVFSMFQQYFTVGLGLLAGDVQRLTGRDLQPPWAHVPGAAVPVARLSDESNTNGTTNHIDSKTPVTGPTAPGATRRPRPGVQGKGRKRGKR